MNQTIKILGNGLMFLTAFAIITYYANENTKQVVRNEFKQLDKSRFTNLDLLDDKFEYNSSQLDSLGAHTNLPKPKRFKDIIQP